MFRIYLVTSLFFIAALSGCFGNSDTSDDDDTAPGGPGDDVGGFGGDGNETFGDNTTTGEAITWIEYPSAVEAPEPIMVSWEVDHAALGAGANGTAGDDANGTGAEDQAGNETDDQDGNETDGEEGDPQDGNASASGTFETGVAYGTFSIAMPETPDEYDNVTGVDTNETDQYAAEIEFDTQEDTTLYVRAYVWSDGEYHWAEELTILVNATASETHEITIRSGTIPMAQFSTFEPRNLEMAPGDSIFWNNTASGSHTIEITGPETHNTGAIAEDEASEPIQLLEPGEYAYECTTHPDTMNGGTITVVGDEEETE